MASRRYRSKLSLNSNIADINAKVSEISKRPYVTGVAENSITNVAITDGTIVADNLDEHSVTNEKLAPESVSKSKLAADVFNNATFTGFLSTPRLFLEEPLSEELIQEGFISPVPTGRIYGLYYPFGVEGSAIDVVGTGATSVTVAVEFFPGVFIANSTNPIVTVTTRNINFVASVSNITFTGFNINLRRIDNAVFTTAVVVNYIAMQF